MTRRTFCQAGVSAAIFGAAASAETPDLRGITDVRARARLLHDRVRDGIAFGWSSNFYAETPSETQTGGIGYCLTKGALLVRDLRANGIPARLVFAEIDAGILSGLIDPGTRMVDHAYVEADLPGETLAFDSHVVDRPLFHAARNRLRAERKPFGFGVHAGGTFEFPGFSQFVSSDIRGEVWGAFETIEAFHAGAPRVWNRLPLLARLAFGWFAKDANDRIAELRKLA